MSFKLIFMDSWDGEEVYVKADGKVVYSVSNTWSDQNYDKINWGWPDNTRVPIFGFNHTGNLLSLEIGSTLDQPPEDEGFGVCDITITLTDNYVDANGNEIANVEQIFANNSIKDIYFSCQSPTEDNEWTYEPAYNTINCSGNTFVGAFGNNGKINTILLTSDSHNSIVVSFILAFIDSWDGESFVVIADDSVVYSIAHSEESSSGSNTCQNEWNDRYINVTFGFNHSAGLLNLTFTSTLDQVSIDAAWGICDLVIALGSKYADIKGNEVGAGIGGTSIGKTIFKCDSPAVDTDWSYDPYFDTINCAEAAARGGNSFLGGYGEGGSLSTLLSIPDSHQGIVVSFKLALIGSWDGEAFYVAVDHRVVYSVFHSSDATTADDNNDKNNSTALDTCQGDLRASYQDVRFGFNHTGNQLSIEFSSFLDEDASEEAWGICDLLLELSSDPIDSQGKVISS